MFIYIASLTLCSFEWGESVQVYFRLFLSSDGHQFQQYQENEQSPLISTEFTVLEARTWISNVTCRGIFVHKGTAIDPVQNRDGVKTG
jgi:hypothetical protein